MYAVTTPLRSFFHVGVSGVTQYLSGQLSFPILFLFLDKLQELFCSLTGLALAEHLFEGAVGHIGAYIRTGSNYKANKPVSLNQYSPPKVTTLSVCHKLKVSIY